MSTGSSCNAGWQLGRATINGKERSGAQWLVGDRLLQSPLSDTCNVNSDIWSHHHPLQGAPAFTFINCSATAVGIPPVTLQKAPFGSRRRTATCPSLCKASADKIQKPTRKAKPDVFKRGGPRIHSRSLYVYSFLPCFSSDCT